MLQLKDICKTYITGDLKQTALDHVSLGFRDNEFVAILGPSGSGKTTMLNIIGGLDRYDSGDLIINQISTRRYKDRDWDSYRNHTIGFVFQSYNLIPHQTILANVELALTISGVSGSERTKRAKEALEKVGLGEQVHKKPSQLSGGQMQRVAIARALVNNPDILLADEPTGALDTETSVQVMDLLKEVAADRLVIMVTHNPELAEQYATRIVRLRDGKIISDTDPFIPEETETVHRNLGHASMSLLTALHLSFNNLRTKMARTLLVSFAGSIGIIGIALIMSLSGGVNQYIHDVEEETLSEYPLQIMSTAVDLSAIAERASSTETEGDGEVRERQTITRMLSGVATNDLYSLRQYLESGTSGIEKYTNAIEYTYSFSPQIFLQYKDKYRQVNPDTTFSALGYGANASSSSMMSSMMSTSGIFSALPEHSELYDEQYIVKAGRWPEKWNECVVVLSSSGRVTDMTLYAMGLLDPDELDDMIKKFSDEEEVKNDRAEKRLKYEDFMDVKFKLVSASDYYIYDSEYGIWVNKNEDKAFMKKLVDSGEDIRVVGVVQAGEDANAAMLTPGIAYHHTLTKHAAALAEDSQVLKDQQADPETNVFTGKGFDDEDSSFDSSKLFSVDEDALSKVFSVDPSKMQMDMSSFDFGSMDLSGIDLSSLDLSNVNLPQPDLAKMLSGLEIKVNREEAVKMLTALAESYQKYAQSDVSTDYTQLPQAFTEYTQTEEGKSVLEEEVRKIAEKSGLAAVDSDVITKVLTEFVTRFQAWMVSKSYTDTSQIAAYLQEYLALEEGQTALNESMQAVRDAFKDVEIAEEDIQEFSENVTKAYDVYASENKLPEVAKIQASFGKYLDTAEAGTILRDGTQKTLNTDEISAQLQKGMQSYMQDASASMSPVIQSAMSQVMSQMGSKIASSMNKAMEGFAKNMQSAFSFNPDALKDAFSMNFSETDLQDLMASMVSTGASYDSNLRAVGYADLSKPYSISIFPNDFEAKEEVIRILDEYNEKVEKAGDKDKVISYTDLVGTLMNSVTTIVDTISYVLIAFVAISLVVSSIMIGVITYISVLERNKEIGILRAIGASKRNISNVFNAETFIIGLLAGLIGIGVTLALLPPVNSLIHSISGNYDVNAFLPWTNAVLLIIISVILTLIGGLIPSRKAARRDPVEALRTE